jgi:hypothetical protein
MNFFRVSSRINTPTLVRSLTTKGGTAALTQGGLTLSLPTPSQTSKFINPSTAFSKWDQSQKHMMIGLGCAVFIDLCAEAMFFKKVPYGIYKNSLEMVKRNPYVQTRLGKDIFRKGNKFGMWPNRERGKKVIVAHYYVQGDRGEAKVVLHVEKKHLVYQPILLLVEFTNLDRLTLLEVEEEEPQPSIMPAL